MPGTSEALDAVVARVAAAAADDAGGIDPTLLGRFLPIVVEAASSGRQLRRAELTACEQRGAVAAQAGVPLRALIDLYLSACWRLWDELEVVASPDAARVRAAGLAVLHAADDAVAALAEGFQLARNDLSRQQESTRREVLERLLAGGPDAATVTGRAADLGLDLSSPHAVLVARRDPSFDEPSGTAVPSRLERALAGAHGDANPLVAVRDGLLVCVFAAPDAASTALVSDRLGAVLADSVPAGAPAPSWRAATGRSRAGAAAVRTSFEQACSALELAEQLRLPSAVVDAAELVVYRVLLRDREAVDELVATVLGPLVGARGGARPLLDTLDAYYETGGVTTAAATRLHLSVRAVTYRLARVRDLLGLDPTDPAHRFELHAAVLAARLLRWPETPLASS